MNNRSTLIKRLKCSHVDLDLQQRLIRFCSQAVVDLHELKREAAFCCILQDARDQANKYGD